ncbi:MAG TPA: ATP-binding protein [Pseudonocardia sp.]|nr:ATP-binding protein [Pseudonocardia sp.]
MLTRWTLAHRVTALVALGAVGVVAAIAVLLVVTNRNEAAVDDLINRVGPARRGAAELLTTLVEEQNAVRGYALSGDLGRRLTYQSALLHEDDNVATLRGLLGTEDSDVTDRLDQLLAQARRWRTEGATPLLDAVVRSGPRPAADATYQMEEDLFGPVLASVRELVTVLDGRRDAAITGLDTYRRTELAALCFGAAVAVAAGSGTLLLLRRWVTRPIERLAQDALRVADGEHSHQVAVPKGPPELSAVAADVERMRSRIVNELAELASSQRELRETRDRLQSQAVDLMRSNRDLEQFAYVASHDLQEPLRKVAGFCQLLQRRYADQLDERAEQYIEFAVDGARRMQRLISELLAFSRVGRADRALADVPLAEVTADALGELAAAGDLGSGGDPSDGAGGPSDARVVVGELPVVRGDATLLRQLMTNLIGNAVKFRRPDTPAEVHVDAVEDPMGWQISVADNGIGIAPEFADKIFVIFQRLHGRESYPGTGIGLALAKRIVEYHGGRIWLDTGRRDGTTIRFSLPAAAERESTSESVSRSRAESPSATEGTT